MDERNSSCPIDKDYDNCNHVWEEIESMHVGSVECIKCGVPGARMSENSVYWPAT